MSETYTYLKKRCEFGKQPMFCEQGPEMIDSIPTDKKEFKQYILRNPVHKEIQHTNVYSTQYINTIRVENVMNGANHPEGGWPKDINILDPEATQRYKRKVEKDDNYINCVMKLNTALEHYILQNNAIGHYQTYFAELSHMPPLERISCRTVNEYRDPLKLTRCRPVTSISWSDEGHQFAVTYNDLDFYRHPLVPVTSYIWNVENAQTPELSLDSPYPVLDLQFSKRSTDILIGGLISGQVGYWDRRVGSAPLGFCPPHVAHREPVRGIKFIASKGVEFFSSGPDGVCKWWDLRNLNDPTDEMIMDMVASSNDAQCMEKSYGVSVLEYEFTIPTRFMVGCENGVVLSGNRKGKTPLEKIPAKYLSHLGPVWSLERSPGFMKYFLTVGDFSVKIWSEECRDSPVLWSKTMRHRVTCGIWSPHRLSLFMLSQSNGVISFWDLLRKQNGSVLSMQVCEEPLTKMNIQENGTHVACGSAKGTIYMVELSPSLAESAKVDKVLMNQILEREMRREKILEARLREIKLKQRQAEEGSVHSDGELDLTIGDKDLSAATTEYMQVVKKEMSMMT